MAGSRERSARGGGRRVIQADVARRAGVSRGLVSLALSGSELVSEASRERIEAAVRDLGYRVNVTASSLASGRSGTIGLVLPNLRNPFFLAQALQEAAGERSLTVLMTLAGGDDDGWAVSTTMVDMGVEGLVLVSPALRAESIRALGRDVPVCLVGHAEVGGCADTVRLDEADAARVVVEHLAAAGWAPGVPDAHPAGRSQCR